MVAFAGIANDVNAIASNADRNGIRFLVTVFALFTQRMIVN